MPETDWLSAFDPEPNPEPISSTVSVPVLHVMTRPPDKPPIALPVVSSCEAWPDVSVQRLDSDGSVLVTRDGDVVAQYYPVPGIDHYELAVAAAGDLLARMAPGHQQPAYRSFQQN